MAKKRFGAQVGGATGKSSTGNTSRGAGNGSMKGSRSK